MRSFLRKLLNLLLLPFNITNCSKLFAVREDLLGRRMSPAVLNNLSAAAELGKEVLYLINNFTQASRWPTGNCSFLTTWSLALTQLMTSSLMASSSVELLAGVVEVKGP